MEETPKTNNKKNNRYNRIKNRLIIIINKIWRGTCSIFSYVFKKKRTKCGTNKKSDNERDRISQQRNRWFQNWGVILNLIMIAAFIISVWYQGSLTRQAINRSDTANANTQKSLVLADTSNNIAKRALMQAKRSADSSYDISKKTFIFNIKSNREGQQIDRRKTRAYLKVGNISFATFQIGKKISVNLEIPNSGLTPAYKFHIVSRTKINKSRVSDLEMDLIDNIPLTGTGSVLSASGSITIASVPEIILSRVDSIEIMNGTKLYSTYGKIFYDDIFGEKHYCRFCQFYNVTTKDFREHGSYNDCY